MSPKVKVTPEQLRQAVSAVGEWLRGGPEPARADVAAAVRASARYLAQIAPGHSVELRIPPFVAVQCIEGPRHTRGTPPNIFESSPRAWLELVIGAPVSDEPQLSGHRAPEVLDYLPLVRI
ncbi:MAG: sterol carrier family protein [Nocardiaceae bacterium]|nr:sterol carrier family protein [Nocardiaceae bacterium]